MYKHVLVAIDLNDDGSWRPPLLAGAEHARKSGAQLTVLTVLREVEPVMLAQVAPVGYEVFVADLENKLAARVRDVNAYDLHPSLIVTHGESIYHQILVLAQEVGADLIVVGSHRPAMKDYLLGTMQGVWCAMRTARSLSLATCREA